VWTTIQTGGCVGSLVTFQSSARFTDFFAFIANVNREHFVLGHDQDLTRSQVDLKKKENILYKFREKTQLCFRENIPNKKKSQKPISNTKETSVEKDRSAKIQIVSLCSVFYF
jgi:hypothetical protein